MDFGDRLKDILESKKLSQADLSNLTTIEEGHISKIINNRLKPSQKTVERIAEALNMPIAAFYDDDIAVKQLVEEVIREMTPEMIDFIKAQKNGPWLYLAKDLSVKNLTPEQVIKVVELWKETVEKTK
jgi:transcriptional regulator with XRE-family HTH domain